jgi:hypothetical protein
VWARIHSSTALTVDTGGAVSASISARVRYFEYLPRALSPATVAREALPGLTMGMSDQRSRGPWRTACPGFAPQAQRRDGHARQPPGRRAAILSEPITDRSSVNELARRRSDEGIPADSSGARNTLNCAFVSAGKPFRTSQSGAKGQIIKRPVLKGSVKARGSKPASTANEKCILTNATMRNDHRRRRELTDYNRRVFWNVSLRKFVPDSDSVRGVRVLCCVRLCACSDCTLIVRPTVTELVCRAIDAP